MPPVSKGGRGMKKKGGGDETALTTLGGGGIRRKLHRALPKGGPGKGRCREKGKTGGEGKE